MAAGLIAAYGSLAAMAGRFLFPAQKRRFRWVYLARKGDFAAGASLAFRTPTGERVTVAHAGTSGGAQDFLALSSTCPHLGCQVHWQAAEKRFFCPCHNGTFDAQGRGTGGPPGEAGQSLPRYPLELRGDLLFIQVPEEGLSS
jgi:Rieske Fe-S protein